MEAVENEPTVTAVGSGTEASEDDRQAQMLAMEAMLGIMARGRGVDEQSVYEWITAALGQQPAAEDTVNRALSFARRMLYGPLPLGS